MLLNEIEKSMLAGEMGEPRRQALEHQQKVGRFFDAPDMVEIAQAHIMADTEALGAANVEYLEKVAAYPEEDRHVAIPTITDPRGADLKQYKIIRQDEAFIDLERRTIAAFEALGVMMTDTINYQPLCHRCRAKLAFGDTGYTLFQQFSVRAPITKALPHWRQPTGRNHATAFTWMNTGAVRHCWLKINRKTSLIGGTRRHNRS